MYADVGSHVFWTDRKHFVLFNALNNMCIVLNDLTNINRVECSFERCAINQRADQAAEDSGF